MSTLPVDPALTPSPEPSPERVPRRLRMPRPRVPRPRTRHEGGRCGNCGFEDSGHYCSRCGETLHGTEDSVLEILWSDLVEGPLHNLFALGKTTWLMLVRPHRFFHGVLLRQRGLAGLPFFLSPAWSRVSHKPHGVPNAVKYFVLIYTLTVVAAWAFDVSVFPEISALFLKDGTKLPGFFADPLFLGFVVFAAWMYAAAVSRLLGGAIETEVLTRFMLYLNGLALIPFVAMAVAGVQHLWVFLAALGFWLYVLFVLPQVALPRLFRIPRGRLAMAQGGAFVANVAIMLAVVFVAGVLANSLGWLEERAVAAGDPAPIDFRQSGISAVERMTQRTVFPMDSLLPLIAFRIEEAIPDVPAPESPRLRPRRPR